MHFILWPISYFWLSSLSLPPELCQDKIPTCSLPCVFVGYSSTNHKRFWFSDPISSCVYITRHAKFDESCIPFTKYGSSQSISRPKVSEFIDWLPYISDGKLSDLNPLFAQSSLPPNCLTWIHYSFNHLFHHPDRVEFVHLRNIGVSITELVPKKRAELIDFGRSLLV